MRTTLTIDDDLLAASKALARAESKTIGEVLSDLARRGLRASRATKRVGKFPVFDVSPDARPITLEDVKRMEDEFF